MKEKKDQRTWQEALLNDDEKDFHEILNRIETLSVRHLITPNDLTALVFSKLSLSSQEFITVTDELYSNESVPGVSPKTDTGLSQLVQRRSVLAQTGLIPNVAQPVSLVEISKSDKRRPEEVTEPTQDPLARYEDLGPLGMGGMAEVRRVRDRDLNRVMAMKIIKPELVLNSQTISRFIEEAQTSAQLEHPGIVPIHDFGRLSDGRFYFTMQEVKGRTLNKLIGEVHADNKDSSGIGENYRRQLNRLIDVYRRACDAVAFAHSRGVIHRDLKPQNMMVGEHGEVLVLDWGLAKVLGRPENSQDWDAVPVITKRSLKSEFPTHLGAITGTPEYMSPEQANGQVDAIDARSDVYTLGIILYEILSGHRAFNEKNLNAVLNKIVSSDITPLEEYFEETPIPEELVAIQKKAMSPDPDSRYLNAVEFSHALSAWHEGDLLRNKALSGISKAEILENEATKLRNEARKLQSRSERKLSKIPAYAEESVKAKFWSKLETSFQLNQQAELKILEAEQVLRGALIHAPDLPETHAALARRYQAAHRIAEKNRDEEAKLRLEIYLQDHTNSLPQGHPAKQYYERYLTAQGEFTLHTEPQGAEVTLYQFETQNRRVVPVYRGLLGYTPIDRHSVPIGSYLLKIVKPGYCTFNYPIQIERQKHWDGVKAGETELSPFALPPSDTIGPGENLVPEGWSWFGGDKNASNTISKRRLWVDSFVIKTYPVSNAEYLNFLNELVQNDRNDDALKCVPRERSAHLGQMGVMNYEQDFLGAFSLPQDSENTRWLPEKPVTSINWHAAMMYAAWKSEKTGRFWRLPSEWEWEKAARGVDGRHYPWGNELDPSWCSMRLSHQDKPAPADIDSYPIDQSVYGVRGMSGNVRDWCLNIYTENIPWSDGESIEIPDLKSLMADKKMPRLVRGGSWMAFAGNCRSAFRFVTTADFHGIDGGFRLVRSI